ncbi:MAG: TIM barrel protein [Planctomycetota bacterium]
MPDSPPLGVTAVMLPELDFDQQVQLCVELGLTHYVFRPREIPDARRGEPYSNWGNHAFDLTPRRLADEGSTLADRLEAAGLVPFGTVPRDADGRDPDRFRLHLDGAAAARCRNVRVALPPLPQGVFDWAAYLDDTRDRLARMLELAAAYPLKLVIEMHAGSPAVDAAAARQLCDGSDPDRLGLIFDLPNLSREGIRHAGLTVSAAGPYLDHAHVGGFTHQHHPAAQRDDAGFALSGGRMCRLEDNDLHPPTWLALFRDLHPAAPLILEDYTPDIPGADRLRATTAATRRVLEPPQ